MPYMEMPKYKSVPDKMYEIPQPGIGGLNLKDLEFEQEPNQSPYMKNVMYRNGAFAKRYGQGYRNDTLYGDEILTSIYYDHKLFVHVVDDNVGKILVDDGTTVTECTLGESAFGGNVVLPTEKGMFLIFGQKLYYFFMLETEGDIIEWAEVSDAWQWKSADRYIPDVLINCEPVENHSEQVEQFNSLTVAFNEVYNTPEYSQASQAPQDYRLYFPEDVEIDYQGRRRAVHVDDVLLNEGTDWEYINTTSGTPSVRFHIQNPSSRGIEAVEKSSGIWVPATGNMNVEITLCLSNDGRLEKKKEIFTCTHYEYFGGNADSRVFLGGNGTGKYYWSDVEDITNFPENNYASLGNAKEDITGFGRQYNILVVFKAHETYSVSSYIQNSSTTIVEEDYGLEAFRTQLINNRIGCDCPFSIQLINNLLTWFNTKEGVCTLVSTNIQDERNIRVISRNIDRTNNLGIKGILDFDEDPFTIQSMDFENKYFLVFPESGYAFVWDYEISPYHYTSNGETPPAKLTWFLFDNFHVGEFVKIEKDLNYSMGNRFIKLNMSFDDFDGPIETFYMTPFMQFGAVESLKNVKNIYVQCRGDTAAKIDMWYYDEETALNEGEPEPESITIGGRLWEHFSWENFAWYILGWASTFRRKCNLKKVQMASFFFKNDELGRDLSITHIGLQYQIIKYIR